MWLRFISATNIAFVLVLVTTDEINQLENDFVFNARPGLDSMMTVSCFRLQDVRV